MQRRYFLRTLAAGGFAAATFPHGVSAQGRRQGGAGSGGPTIEAREFLRLDGSAEDEAFAALVRRLNGLNGPATVRFPSSARGQLLLAAGRQHDLPAGLRWDFGQTRVRFDGQIPGNSVLFRFGSGSEVLGLNLELGRAARCDRLLTVLDDTLLDRLRVVTEIQLANGNDNGDALVQIRGSRVRLSASSITGADRAVAAIGFGAKQGDSQALTDLRIDDLSVRDFVRGVFLRNAQNVRIVGLVAERKSANGKTQPGHNGVLASRVQDFVLEKFRIEETGEHAIRIGGGTSPYEVPNRGIRISDGQIRRPGKCGVKFWAAGKAEDVDDARVVDATVRSLKIYDCGFRSKLGPNEDGVRLEVVDGFVVENIVVGAERQAFSCHDAVYLAACKNGTINGIDADRPARSAVYITEELVAGARREPVGRIRGENIRSTGHRGDFIHVDMPSQAGGPFEFRGLSAQGGANFIGGNAPKLDAGSRFDGMAKGQSGAVNALGRGRGAPVTLGR